MIRYIFLLACLCMAGVEAQAQKFFTLDAAYQNLAAEQWNYSIRFYNFSRPWLSEKMPLLSGGKSLSIGYSAPMGTKLRFSPSLQWANFTANATNFGEEITLSANFVSLSLNVDFYPMADDMGTQGLYLRLSNALSLVTPRVYVGNETFELDVDEPYRPMTFAFGLGGGLGYNIALSEKLWLTPNAALLFYPAAELDDWDVAVHGTHEPGLSNESSIVRWQAGVTLAYKIK